MNKKLRDRIYAIVTRAAVLASEVDGGPDEFCDADGFLHDSMEFLWESYGICGGAFEDEAHELIHAYVGNPARGEYSDEIEDRVPAELDKELKAIARQQRQFEKAEASAVSV